MSYGLQYQTQFRGATDRITGNRGLYTLKFLRKNYTGVAQSLTGGQTTFIPKSLVDQPFGIKAQAADIRLLNYGNLPVTAFYADEDDGVKVELSNEDGTVLFVGFVVQDDLTEPMVAYTHEISLTATDGLGLLKGIILSDAPGKRAFLETRIITNGSLSEILMSITDTAFNPVVGNSVEFLGGTYEITSIDTTPVTIGGTIYTYTLGITPDLAASIPATDTTVYLIGPVDLIGKNSFLTLINICLYATNLPLIVNIYSTLNEWNQDFARASLEQTLVDSQVFMNGDVFDDCYATLDNILSRFNCTLMQAYGQWQIVHWDELREFPAGNIPGYQYDDGGVFLGATTLNNTFNIGPDPQLTRPAGFSKGSQRGLKFVRNQFNYIVPKYLFRNFDLQKLGAFRREYISSGFKYQEYEFPANSWTHIYSDVAYIVVVTDVALDAEVSRYVYQPKINNGGAGYLRFNNVQINNIEVNRGDRFSFTANIKTASSTGSDVVTFRWGFYLRVATGHYYNLVDVTVGSDVRLLWNSIYADPIQSTGINQVIDPTYSNPQDFNTFDLDSLDTVTRKVPGFPEDGILTIRVYGTADTNAAQPNVDAIWNNIGFNLFLYVNETTRITGQVHKYNKNTVLKQNIDDAREMDDSPKNAISGTLFLTQTEGLLQKRARIWRKGNVGNVFKLGEITTRENLEYRKVTRTKIEGTFMGIWQDGFISMLCPVVTTYDPTKVYVWGPLTIDYKRNQCSGTLYEVYDSAEPELDADYTFQYLYDNK